MTFKKLISETLFKAAFALPESSRKLLKLRFPKLAQAVILGTIDTSNWLHQQQLRAKVANNSKEFNLDEAGPKKIHMYGPWAPTLNGLADYGKSLAEAIQHKETLRIYKTYFDEGDSSLGKNVFPLNMEAEVLSNKTINIFNLGNGKHNWLTWSEILKNPGYIIAHDPKIPDIICSPEENKKWLEMDYDEKAKYYYGRVPSHIKAIFVHSKFAQEIIEKQIKSAKKSIPVLKIPTGHPYQNAEKHKFNGQIKTIGTFGIQNASKNPILTYQILSYLCSINKSNGIVCGNIDNNLKKLCKKIWISFGNNPNKLKITGKVSDSVFEELIEQVDIGIQLRKDAHGESSGPVAKLISRGIPVVISDLGSFSEIDCKGVYKVAAYSEFEQASLELINLVDLLHKPNHYLEIQSILHNFAKARTFDKAWEYLSREIKRLEKSSKK